MVRRRHVWIGAQVKFNPHIVPLAIFFGFVCPTLLGSLWDDALGGYIWGGLVAKLCSKR